VPAVDYRSSPGTALGPAGLQCALPSSESAETVTGISEIQATLAEIKTGLKTGQEQTVQAIHKIENDTTELLQKNHELGKELKDIKNDTSLIPLQSKTLDAVAAGNYEIAEGERGDKETLG